MVLYASYCFTLGNTWYLIFLLLVILRLIKRFSFIHYKIAFYHLPNGFSSHWWLLSRSVIILGLTKWRFSNSIIPYLFVRFLLYISVNIINIYNTYFPKYFYDIFTLSENKKHPVIQSNGKDFEVGNKEETSRFSVVLCWKTATTTNWFSSLEHKYTVKKSNHLGHKYINV